MHLVTGCPNSRAGARREREREKKKHISKKSNSGVNIGRVYSRLQVASGLPNKNGDKHAKEICSLAITLQAAGGMVVRPDKKPNTIDIQAGVHTGGCVSPTGRRRLLLFFFFFCDKSPA